MKEENANYIKLSFKLNYIFNRLINTKILIFGNSQNSNNNSYSLKNPSEHSAVRGAIITPLSVLREIIAGVDKIIYFNIKCD